MRDTRRGTAGGYRKVAARHVTPLHPTDNRYVPFRPDYGKRYGLPTRIPVDHRVPRATTLTRSAHAAARAVARRTNATPVAPHPHRNVHAPNGNKAHAGNTNAPGNATRTNQSYGPPTPTDASPPGQVPAQTDQSGDTATLLDPNAYANTAADTQFGADITAAQQDAAKQAAQAPANLAQLDAMYQGVESAQADAATKNVASGNSASASQDAMVQGLVASLGGAANPGSAGVAQAGVDASALIRSLNTIQQGTDTDLGVALKQEAAGQHVVQQRMDSSNAADLAAKIAALRGQRGTAVAAARLDAIKYNNDARQQNYTNVQNAQEQKFQNKIAAQNAIIAARAAGDNHLATQLQLAYAQAHPEEAFGKYKPKTTKASRAHVITPSDLSRATKAAQSNILTTVKNPDTGQTRQILDPRIQHNVKALVAAVNAGFAGLHSTNKSALAARNRVLRMYGVTPQPGWNF